MIRDSPNRLRDRYGLQYWITQKERDQGDTMATTGISGSGKRQGRKELVGHQQTKESSVSCIWVGWLVDLGLY